MLYRTSACWEALEEDLNPTFLYLRSGLFTKHLMGLDF